MDTQSDLRPYVFLSWALQDEELDISPDEIDDALVIEEDDMSEDEDDDHEEVI